MQLHKPVGVATLKAAQEWARELPSAGYLRRQEFARWIKYSPEHLQAYLVLTALETELGGVRQATHIDLESVLTQSLATVATLPSRFKSDSPGPSFERPSSLRSVRAISIRMAAIAAGVVFLILGAWLLNRQLAPLQMDNAELATDIGQRRSFALKDGTVIQLNTNSAMRLNYDADRRYTTLYRGEAWIRVGADSNRPFAVDVGSVRIKDVGTEFTVRAEPNETTVFVIQGRVQLTIHRTDAENERVTWRVKGASGTEGAGIVELARNEEAVIHTNGERDPQLHSRRTLTASEAHKRIAWTAGRLVLTGEPLTEVVREINRYHRQQLVIADPALEQVKVGGVIDPATNDYRIIVRALGTGCPIAFDDSNPALVRLTLDQTNGVCNDK